MSAKPKQPWDRISREARAKLVTGVQAWFLDERGEEVGELAATLLLEHVVNLTGPYLYNAALADADTVFRQYADLVAADLTAMAQETDSER